MDSQIALGSELAEPHETSETVTSSTLGKTVRGQGESTYRAGYSPRPRNGRTVLGLGTDAQQASRHYGPTAGHFR